MLTIVIGQMLKGAKLKVIKLPLSNAINSANDGWRFRILSGMDMIWWVSG